VRRCVLRGSARDRRAVLVLDSMVGWYEALVAQGDQLPATTGRSWHVEVFVRPVGSRGTYRRSRQTAGEARRNWDVGHIRTIILRRAAGRVPRTRARRRVEHRLVRRAGVDGLAHRVICFEDEPLRPMLQAELVSTVT